MPAIQVRIMHDGVYEDIFQIVQDGQVTGYQDNQGKTVALPQVYEAMVLGNQIYSKDSWADADVAVDQVAVATEFDNIVDLEKEE